MAAPTRQIAALRTGTTPTQMAITFDQQYLIVGHDNSQFAYVYDLDTLAAAASHHFPAGPLSALRSRRRASAILALVRDVAGDAPGRHRPH